jgi:hypothetical protein
VIASCLSIFSLPRFVSRDVREEVLKMTTVRKDKRQLSCHNAFD